MVPWEIEDTANEMLTSCQIQALNLYADRCEHVIAIQRHSRRYREASHFSQIAHDHIVDWNEPANQMRFSQFVFEIRSAEPKDEPETVLNSGAEPQALILSRTRINGVSPNI